MGQYNSADPGWRRLYQIGGIAALLAVFVFRRNLGAELALLANLGIIDGVPTTPLVSAIDWFNLFQDNRLIGLTLMNFFDLVEYALLGLIFLALYVALKPIHPSAMLIGTTAGLMGITLYFASNQSLAMLSLSERYAAATDAQRSSYLAAGEALLAINHPESMVQGAGIYVSYFLVLLAGLIGSVVMWQSNIFGKVTAIMGMFANGIALFYFIGLAFSSELYWIPHPVSAPFRVIWYFLIALRFIKLAKA